MLAGSTNAYILKCYIYKGAKFDPTSGIAGTGYDVVVRLMEMGKCFDKGHHLFTDNLLTTFAAASYLLERNTFLTGTMRRNQLKHLPNEIVSEVYYRKEKFLAMSYCQKQSQTKPLIMLSTFCGAFDVPQRKSEDKTIPAMVDMYNQNMGAVDSSEQVMYSYAFDHGRKRLFST